MAELVVTPFPPRVELPIRRQACRIIKAHRQVHEPPGVLLVLDLVVFATLLAQLPWRELDVSTRNAAFLNGEVA